MARWIALTGLVLGLLGCNQDKSIKKGTNEGLKIEGTTVVTKGGQIPESKSKIGLGGKTDGAKTGAGK